jgi:hypothetical protein
MLTINRYCHSLKILHLIRSHFSLFNNCLPIILHEVTTDEEILLTDETSLSMPINYGIYLALIKYDERKYQPLIDLKLIPIEIFPEKKFLPKSMPFIIDEINSFVKTLNNMIDYMKEYEKNQVFSPKDNHSPSRSISQISTIKRSGKNSIYFIIFNFNFRSTEKCDCSNIIFTFINIIDDSNI